MRISRKGVAHFAAIAVVVVLLMAWGYIFLTTDFFPADTSTSDTGDGLGSDDISTDSEVGGGLETFDNELSDLIDDLDGVIEDMA